jgi:hypothetical protein
MIILLFIFTPTFLGSIVIDMFTDLGIASTIFSSVLPALIILFYVEVVVPIVIDYMVGNEKHYRKSDES